MKLTILGSGTCVPSLKRNAPGYLLEIEDKKILIDCGGGTLLQLERVHPGLYKEIDYVFVTHTHIDHIADLAPLIQSLNWTPEFTREKELIVIGPKGFKKFYENIIKVLAGRPKGTYDVKAKEINDVLKLDGFLVKAMKTLHSDDSHAYRFENKRKSVVFSGDAKYNENMVLISKETDLLVIECSFTDQDKKEGHLTSSECGKISQKANVNKVILTHLYPPISTEQERLKQCKKEFNGEVVLGEDLMVIKL
jgi:ribonuclease BN (tRNA processing enzyme)